MELGEAANANARENPSSHSSSSGRSLFTPNSDAKMAIEGLVKGKLASKSMGTSSLSKSPRQTVDGGFAALEKRVWDQVDEKLSKMIDNVDDVLSEMKANFGAKLAELIQQQTAVSEARDGEPGRRVSEPGKSSPMPRSNLPAKVYKQPTFESTCDIVGYEPHFPALSDHPQTESSKSAKTTRPNTFIPDITEPSAKLELAANLIAGAGSQYKSTTLFVEGFRSDTFYEEVSSIFEPFGRIVDISIPPVVSGIHGSLARVEFAHVEHAVEAKKQADAGKILYWYRPLRAKFIPAGREEIDLLSHLARLNSRGNNENLPVKMDPLRDSMSLPNSHPIYQDLGSGCSRQILESGSNEHDSLKAQHDPLKAQYGSLKAQYDPLKAQYDSIQAAQHQLISDLSDDLARKNSTRSVEGFNPWVPPRPSASVDKATGFGQSSHPQESKSSKASYNQYPAYPGPGHSAAFATFARPPPPPRYANYNRYHGTNDNFTGDIGIDYYGTGGYGPEDAW